MLLLGEVYKKQGKEEMATRTLAVAKDLDPKFAGKIAKLLGGSTGAGGSGGRVGIGGAGTGGGASVDTTRESALSADVSMDASVEE